MTRTVTTQATPEEHTNLGILLWSQGIPANECVAHLKAQKYIVNGKHYKGASVAYVISGIERVNAGIMSGKLKATKTKGLSCTK